MHTCNTMLYNGMISETNLGLDRGLNLLVCQPAKATQAEELPLVPAHTNVHDGFIDDFRLAYSSSVL